MKVTTIAAAFLLSFASAIPYKRAATSTLSANDESVLNLAIYLEHLEYALYSSAYNDFTDAQYLAAGLPSGFRDNVGVIAEHESIHAATLSGVLQSAGGVPPPPCTYAFPYSDPLSFAKLANMVTSVGIGAYLGGSAELMDNAQLLTSAGAILTVEARHDAYLRVGFAASPFPAPFDTPLTAAWAYNLAQAFIVECPVQLPLPIFPMLSLDMDNSAGSAKYFSFDVTEVSVASSTTLYLAWINQLSTPIYTVAQSCGSGCVYADVPPGVVGAAFVVLTCDNGDDEPTLSANGTLAGPQVVIVD